MSRQAKSPRLCSDSDDEVARRKAHLQEQITIWVGNVRLAETLKRKELASLEGVQRHLALSKSTIPASMARLRRHPRESAGMALYNLIAHLCDNNDGICTLSMNRMAQLFDRTRKCIVETIESLEADGLICIERVNGQPNAYWPKVPAAIATMSPAVTWFVDALSTSPKWGRPSAASSGEVENPSPLGDTQKTRNREVTGGVTESAETRNREPHSISLGDIPTSSEERGAQARRAPDEVPVAESEIDPPKRRAPSKDRRRPDAGSDQNGSLFSGESGSKTSQRRRRLTLTEALESGWGPSHEAWELAARMLGTDDDAKMEFVQFTRWWRGKDEPWSDWNEAFLKWVGDELKKRREKAEIAKQRTAGRERHTMADAI